MAFGKLQGLIDSKALDLPGKHKLNAAMAAGTVAGLGMFLHDPNSAAGLIGLLGGGVLLPSFLGAHMCASVGGADAPVLICTLNSSSGFALVAEGLILGNELLTITGALIGCSGAILSHIMCKAMNRTLSSVLLGGYGTKSTVAGSGERKQVTGTHQAIGADGAGELLTQAKKVVIVPGYGLAVSRGQYARKLLLSPDRCQRTRGFRIAV